AAAARRAANLARVHAGLFLCSALAALTLSGCISLPQTGELSGHAPPGLPPRVDLENVPFFAQNDFMCGPAALAMVINAAGRQVTMESLEPQVYLPGRKGSLQAEMLGATRRAGLVAYTLDPKMDALMRELAAGHPAVVLLDLSFRIAPIWHYA